MKKKKIMPFAIIVLVFFAFQSQNCKFPKDPQVKVAIKKVLESKAEIGVVVDSDYYAYWKERLDDPQDDTESLVIEQGKIMDLGETNCEIDKARVRYVGLVKFSKKSVKILKKVYHENKKRYYDKDVPWLRSRSFKKAYMTSLLQAIINAGHEVKPIIIKRGWLEFDTEQDYERYIKWINEGTLIRFFDFEK